MRAVKPAELRVLKALFPPLDTLTPQVLADALVSMADVAEKLRKTLPFDNSAGAETNSIDLDSLRDSVILRG